MNFAGDWGFLFLLYVFSIFNFFLFYYTKTYWSRQILDWVWKTLAEFPKSDCCEDDVVSISTICRIKTFIRNFYLVIPVHMTSTASYCAHCEYFWEFLQKHSSFECIQGSSFFWSISHFPLTCFCLLISLFKFCAFSPMLIKALYEFLFLLHSFLSPWVPFFLFSSLIAAGAKVII